MHKYLVIVLLFLCSCTFARQLFVENQSFKESFDIAGSKKAATLAKKEQAENKKQKKAPLSVEVAQAFFDQERLNIKIVLTSLTEINPDDIVLGVSGLTDGELVEEVYKKLSDVVASESLESNTKIAIRFELTEKDLTEYQVRCSWGKEAKELWAKLDVAKDKNATEQRALLSKEQLSLPALSGKLEITNLDIESEELDCVLAPCDISYRVIAKFMNGEDKLVKKARLAVGLYWANDGQLPQIPAADSEVNDNEELVEVALGLQSRESATVKIKLDRSVPQVPGGSFIPHVRLIDAE